MQRFVARPVVVDAHRHAPQVMLPEGFRPLLRRYYGASVEITTGGGPRLCGLGDWIVRGPYGDVNVVTAAAFEASYAEMPPEVPAVLDDIPPEPDAPADRVKRAYHRTAPYPPRRAAHV